MFNFLKRRREPKRSALAELSVALGTGSLAATKTLADGWSDVTGEEEMSQDSQWIVSAEMLCFLLHMMDRYANRFGGPAVRQALDDTVMEPTLRSFVSSSLRSTAAAKQSELLRDLVERANDSENDYSSLDADDAERLMERILRALGSRIGRGVEIDTLPLHTATVAAGAEGLLNSNLRECVEAACRERA